jgi:DNA-binding CsgD family transcriptional regulator
MTSVGTPKDFRLRMRSRARGRRWCARRCAKAPHSALVHESRQRPGFERDSARLHSRYGTAAARRSRGFIADIRGDHTEAENCFADSAAAFAGLGVPLEAARGTLALGSVLRRGGQRRRARETLEAARTTFVNCGARGLATECEAELGRISGRVASTSSELTESERQVAHLVSTGMRNVDVARALHLSTKTVEAHLGHIYRKLNVANRTELTTRIAARNAGD